MIQKNWQELIKPNKIEFSSKGKTLTTLVAEPLERGFGLTLGNALRRVLLSSLRGAAVTAVQIDGVLHEFSSIAGVREDVTDIVLEHQGNRHQDGRRRPQAHGRAQAGPGRRRGRRHPDGRRRRDPQPRPRHLHARRGRGDPHGVHRQHRQGLCAGRPQPRRGRADRPDPGRQPVFAGQEGLLQGREHPRGPGSRLRQADHDDRDRRLDHRRGRRGLRGAHPAGPARPVRQFRRAAEGSSRQRPSPSSPSTRRCSRRSTSSSFRCVRPTA